MFSLAAPLLKTLTKKPTVRWSLEEGVVAKEFSEITVGMQLIGWIKNIMSYGVFVEFPYGLVGLAPKSVSNMPAPAEILLFLLLRTSAETKHLSPSLCLRP